MNKPPGEVNSLEAPRPLRWEWLLVWASFALFASIRAQIPGVNEPHYLTKARHFWDPTWCGRDPFLQSVNAHYVYYCTIGVLTRLFTFEQTAWIGRLFGWGLLASGWCALSSRLSPIRWSSLFSAWVFLGLAAIGNWSGEWVIGGTEAKVISYACAWWSLASVIVGHPIRAGAWAGVAVSFHPVVGIWHTGAAFLAAIISSGFTDWKKKVRTLMLSGVAWLVCAAPGLIPAVAMIRAANPAEAYSADYIQVYGRLKHHLDPSEFKPGAYVYYGILIAMILTIRIVSRPHGNWKLTFRYAVIAILIAVSGLVVALPKFASIALDKKLLPGLQNQLTAIAKQKNQIPKWMKFYPFRLADVVIPMVLAMQGTHGLMALFGSRFTNKMPPGSAAPRFLTRSYRPWIAFGAIFTATICSSLADRTDNRLKPEMFPGWLDVCQWLRRETPEDALCYAPTEAFGLKWYAERAEYVSQKDCPQDAAGIVAWNNRLLLINKWSKQYGANGYSSQQVQDLHERTGIDFVITPVKSSKLAKFPMPPAYVNESYVVYRLTDAQ